MQIIGISLVEHENCYVVGIRPEGAVLAGFAEFPGGKQLLPENTSETAIRECREETGLLVEALRLLHQEQFTYEHGEVLLDFWHCKLVDGQSPDSLQAPWKWIPRNELDSYSFPPANAVVLEQIRISTPVD
ncbi:MAG TPA: hypothetical protein DD473_02525 [Planctomycetaceae bacterium]|nr:hypothetical protein [Planctomycetaceae bacterium]